MKQMFGTVTCCKLNFMYRLAVLSMLLWVACTAPNRIISFTAKTKPVYSIDPLPQKILLLNANDIVAKKYRDSKEELFISLTDNLMNWISKRVLEKEGIPAEVIKGYTSITGNTDSILKVLLSKYNATHAIVLQSFDVYFDQTNVEVVKGSDGVKNITASYDIVPTNSKLFHACYGEWFAGSRSECGPALGGCTGYEYRECTTIPEQFFLR